MSGGLWDYRNNDLEYNIFGYSENNGRIPNVFEDQEISNMIYEIFELLRTFDYYKSGDYDKTDYLEVKRKFKEKWLHNTDPLERTRDIIEEKISELRKELYETFLEGTNEQF